MLDPSGQYHAFAERGAGRYRIPDPSGCHAFAERGTGLAHEPTSRPVGSPSGSRKGGLGPLVVSRTPRLLHGHLWTSRVAPVARSGAAWMHLRIQDALTLHGPGEISSRRAGHGSVWDSPQPASKPTGVYGTHRSPRAPCFGQYMKLLRTPPEITRPGAPAVWGAPDLLGLGYSLSQPVGRRKLQPPGWQPGCQSGGSRAAVWDTQNPDNPG